VYGDGDGASGFHRMDGDTMTLIWKADISLKGRGGEYDPFRHKTKYENAKA
jgi:hypothetical protein